MENRIINPWTWQDQFGFVQATEVNNSQHILFCAGQTAMSAEGKPVHAGDMRAQIIQIFDNLDNVLQQSGYSLSNVLRLNYYTTDVDRFFKEYDIIKQHLEKSKCRPASTLLGVQRLAFPELLVEIEATAVM